MTTQPKHTPAPWAVHKFKGMPPHLMGGDHVRIALLDDCHEDDEAEANFRLIAAAPDNYESNKELHDIVIELCRAYNHPLPQAALNRSAAAIAKATGGN